MGAFVQCSQPVALVLRDDPDPAGQFDGVIVEALNEGRPPAGNSITLSTRGDICGSSLLSALSPAILSEKLAEITCCKGEAMALSHLTLLENLACGLERGLWRHSLHDVLEAFSKLAATNAPCGDGYCSLDLLLSGPEYLFKNSVDHAPILTFGGRDRSPPRGRNPDRRA